MSKERALLAQCRKYLASTKGMFVEHNVLLGKINDLLAQPEGGSLSSKEIADFLDSKDEANFEISYDYERGFEDGVRFAESHYGIGVS